jgi:hypothetical protein
VFFCSAAPGWQPSALELAFTLATTIEQSPERMNWPVVAMPKLEWVAAVASYFALAQVHRAHHNVNQGMAALQLEIGTGSFEGCVDRDVAG